MLTRATRHAHRESGTALVAAIALFVLASFVIVAIMVGGFNSRDNSRERLDTSATEQLARDAGTVLTATYSSADSGEFDGFVPSGALLAMHVAVVNKDAKLLPNTDARVKGAGPVDPRVPVNRQYTVMEPLEDGRFGFWQVFSVRMPTWGVTKGGNTSVYVRAWTDGGNAASATQPMIWKLQVRPTWFADYQMIVDGPVWFMGGAIINGRIHSNGHTESFFDQYGPYTSSWQIRLGDSSGSAICKSSARITTARGKIMGSGSCTGSPTLSENTGNRINLLRAKDLADRLRNLCKPGVATSVSVRCIGGAGSTSKVTLGGGTVSTPAGTANAMVTGDSPGKNQGAIVIADGNVEVTGRLSNGARALIVAASPTGAANYGSGGAPSVWLTDGVGSSNEVGASSSPTSSFGIVAEGDVVLDQRTLCPATVRGAFVSMTGLMSTHPTWRIPFDVGGGPANRWCGGTATVEGSIAGHFPPQMISSINGAGYNKRLYTMLDSLYHNPPPMYPTAADWAVTKFAPADLDCFTKSGSSYTLKPSC